VELVIVDFCFTSFFNGETGFTTTGLQFSMADSGGDKKGKIPF